MLQQNHESHNGFIGFKFMVNINQKTCFIITTIIITSIFFLIPKAIKTFANSPEGHEWMERKASHRRRVEIKVFHEAHDRAT